MGLERDQTFMLTFAQRDAPCGAFNISGIDHFLEQSIDRHRAKRSGVLVVFWKVRISLQEPLHLRLRSEMAVCEAFQSGTHN
ncbi:MAG: hypothetical protein AAF636_19685 [Pseudomonadota bacterium]